MLLWVFYKLITILCSRTVILYLLMCISASTDTALRCNLSSLRGGLVFPFCYSLTDEWLWSTWISVFRSESVESLPIDIRYIPSLLTFRHRLKCYSETPAGSDEHNIYYCCCNIAKSVLLNSLMFFKRVLYKW